MKNKQYTQKPEIVFYDLGANDMIDASNGILYFDEQGGVQPPLNPPSTDKGYGGISWKKNK